MMYSSSFFSRETYEKHYGGPLDPATRAKVDPERMRPSVFQKTAHPSILGHDELELGY